MAHYHNVLANFHFLQKDKLTIIISSVLNQYMDFNDIRY
jgi:hypothetical protein